MELIQVEFHPGGQRYTYSAGDHAVAVGDQVMVPTSNPYVGETVAQARVVAIGSDFAGEAKRIAGIVKKE